MKEIEDLSVNASELLPCVLIKKSQKIDRDLKSSNKHPRENINTAM